MKLIISVPKKKIRSLFLQIGELIRPGRTEKELFDAVSQLIEHEGYKIWHPTVIKVDISTVTPSVKHTPSSSLQLADICIVDLGVVIDGFEADFAWTYAFKPELNSLTSAAQELLTGALQLVDSKKHSPSQVFAWIEEHTAQKGFYQVSTSAGHRLGSYPTQKSHTRVAKTDPQESFEPGGWMIEIHIADKKLQRGAFFEDFIFVN